MPGTLPAASAYTYAVELSLDQALSGEIVSFLDSSTYAPVEVPVYVDNFLDMAVGQDVSVGFYHPA